MNEERLRGADFVERYKDVLQAIVDGKLKESEYTRLISKIPHAVIARALRLVVENDQIDYSKLEDIRPKKPLNVSDGAFIKLIYEGKLNSQIMNEAELTMDEVNYRRRRIFRMLGVGSDAEVVVWEAVQRKRSAKNA